MNIGQVTTTLRRLRTVGNCLQSGLFVSRRWNRRISIALYSRLVSLPRKGSRDSETPRQSQGRYARGIREGTQLNHAWPREATPADGGRRLGIRIFREIAARGPSKWLKQLCRERTAAMPGQEPRQGCLKSITTAVKLFNPLLESL